MSSSCKIAIVGGGLAGLAVFAVLVASVAAYAEETLFDSRTFSKLTKMPWAVSGRR